ncbi:MAG TPA: monofunctional biosynthetic peptidoglycan transglycosylase [Rhizomicrobium sp.]|jgi:monofunctional biosynthetic peptidoglycan transglycosylase|nr:monofunctional biosynthetic peptidoglycan transglycosylase [Rhizomicrobium sp.]
MRGWLDRLAQRLGDARRWYWDGRGERKPWFRRALAFVFFILVVLPVFLILLFRFVPVPVTPDLALAFFGGEPVHYSWRDGGEIAPALGRAVIASEDERFCQHNGFDWKSIDTALKQHERYPKRQLRGASTLSQQTARSLLLTPERSWVRKGLEAYFTVLIEALWPKQRILTAYLNLVDWGHGNFGAEAASQAYFGKPASALSPLQAARLAVILPDPDGWKAANPGPYVARRSGTILARMAMVTRDGLDICVRH